MYTQEAQNVNQFLLQNKSCFNFKKSDGFVLPKFDVALEEINSKIKTKTTSGQKRGRKRHGVYRK